MKSPFYLATKRIINRVGQVVTFTTELGEELSTKAVLSNPQRAGFIRQQGKGSGGLDFKANAKRLRVMTESVPNLSKDWEILVNGEAFFPADWDDDGRDGSTLIYMAKQQPKKPEGGHVWK